MNSNSITSFVNGAIGGAGVVLAIMSIALLLVYQPLELENVITTTEIRVAIFLGFVVFAVASLYEIYRKKNNYNQEHMSDELGNSKQKM